MKNIAMPIFKTLVKQLSQELLDAAMLYVQSEEFKKSEYDLYSPRDLVDAIESEEYEYKRFALYCLLQYRAEQKRILNRASLRL
jgi:hypothetical protein